MARRSVGWFAREIVAKRAIVLVGVTAVVHLAVARGWLNVTDDQTQAWTERVVDLVGFLLAAGWIRGGVTPADIKLNPTASDGQLLVPENVMGGAKASGSTPNPPMAYKWNEGLWGPPYR